jgi:hypothetical protein
MRLPEFVLSVTATLVGVAAALAVLASKYRFARVLFWIAALSFGSLGVVWSATSEGYSLPTQMLVAAVIGAVAAAGLTWALWEIRGKERAEKTTAATTAEGMLPTRGPTLEATQNAAIDATGSVIPGDLPWQFARAADGAIIDMPGTVITRKEDGSMTIQFGAVPVTRQFPPPTGEFSKFSNSELRERAQEIAAALRDFQGRLEGENRTLPRLPQGGIADDVYKQFSDKYSLEYHTKFVGVARSIASEMIDRISKATPEATFSHRGANMLYWKSFAGPKAALTVSEFLNLLAQQLPN